MKKTIKAFSLFVIIFSLVLFCEGCGWHPPRPQYASQYTEEEQVYRITCEAKHRYEDVLNSGEMLTFSAHILYTFDDFPEYFLIEHTWKNYSAYLNYLKGCGYYVYEFENVDLNAEYYSHIVGYVKNDCYYVGMYAYSHAMHGKSYYTKSGAIEAGYKLYFSNSTYAYLKGDNLVGSDFHPEYWIRFIIEEERIITVEEKNRLAKSDRTDIYRGNGLLITNKSGD